jgi:hypothetical protein
MASLAASSGPKYDASQFWSFRESDPSLSPSAITAI